MAKLRVCKGSVSLGGSNTVKIGYGSFTGVPAVVATVESNRNGATVKIVSKSASGATLAAFYNGGLRLTEGTINWVAVGDTNEIRRCGCGDGGHICTVCDVYAG